MMPSLRIRVVVFCMLLGAIINFAVAWSLAWKVPFRDDSDHPRVQGVTSDNAPCWAFVIYTRFGSTRVHSQFNPQINETLKAEHWGNHPERLPMWSIIKENPAFVAVRSSPLIVEEARGWPFRALQFRLESLSNRGVALGFSTQRSIANPPIGGIVVEPTRMLALGVGGPKWQGTSLPYRPIVGGFIANTLFYALLLGYPLWRLVHFTVHGYRKRRGLCPACRYNLRSEFDTGCPECGWNRADQPRRT